MVRTYAYLFESANWAIETARETQQGTMYPCMHAVLSAVHSLEAYFNHLGEGRIENWDQPGLSRPKEKFKTLRSELGLKVSDLRPSYDEYFRALKFRDALVHGRTESRRGEWSSELHGRDISAALPVSWEEFTTLDKAEQTVAAIETLLKLLGEAAGETEFHYVILEQGSMHGPAL